MKRRHFLKYSGLGAAGFTFAACSPTSKGNSPQPSPVAKDFGKPEKTTLKIGYVPTLASAPLWIAQEKGIFARYGLTVTLKKQPSWQALERDLLGWQVDAAQALYPLPLAVKFRSKPASMVALMALNLNGGAITFSERVWKAGLRPAVEYIQWAEFGDSYAAYLRDRKQPLSYGIESPIAMEALLYRYWLGAIGVDPDNAIKLEIVGPTRLAEKLKAGTLEGYAGSAPWNQQAVQDKLGFTTYLSRDIWKGHPGKILAAMEGWVDQHPNAAKALVAALIEACQFCDDPKNQAEVVQILAKPEALNSSPEWLIPNLSGNYLLSHHDRDRYTIYRPDLNIFHYKSTDYLKPPDQANYLWQSHGVWALTQLIRWRLVNLTDYPKDADRQLAKLYPLKTYQAAAQALGIKLPKETMKTEAAHLFVDRRGFDPSQPVAYLNQFTLRANCPQFFT
jgi:nitrate/nitrite transport system substrate-binding protein